MSLRRPLAVLAGARPEILAKAPGDLTKHAVMGGVLLSTAGLAGVAAFFALASTLDLPWWIALISGLIWFVIILNLDRMLVVTLNNTTGWRAVGVAVPRILMAAVIGTVVATPLTLQIFQPEINAELQTMRAEAVTQVQVKLNEAYKQIDALQAQEKQLQDAIAGRGTGAVSADQDVVAAQAVYDKAQATYLDAERAAQCELNGGCGTGRPGIGEAYLTARAAADQAIAVRDDAKRKLDNATQVATSRIQQSASAAATDAEKKLGAVQSDLAAAEERKRQATGQALDAEGGNTGLLARLEALDRITDGHATASAAKWALSLLFFLIEVLPVVGKLLTMIGKRTVYDLVLARHDEEIDNKDQLDSAARRQIDKDDADAVVLLAKQQTDAKVKASQDAMDELVTRQGQISMDAIRTWAEVAKLRADEQLDEWYRRHVGPLAVRPGTTGAQPGAVVGAQHVGLGGACQHANTRPGGTPGQTQSGGRPGAVTLPLTRLLAFPNAAESTVPIPVLHSNDSVPRNGSGPAHSSPSDRPEPTD
ncbi:DUF4407 domain-containing protein [Actinokineospora inagensis]|uniref:DUF4407 domain-containing protein n=1 Tax=Actinokineospora inagensis TaxID=103730 RepID=UPI0004258892|nr:DUF4407 domain-containing protein [Actinokineospora inagensis]